MFPNIFIYSCREYCWTGEVKVATIQAMVRATIYCNMVDEVLSFRYTTVLRLSGRTVFHL